MARRERRHSFDLTYCQNDGTDYYEGGNSQYEQDKGRRVHFDDEYLMNSRRQKQHRNRDDIREMNVYETTSRLKESYCNIDKGLEILRRIYNNLMQSKQCLRYRSENSRNEYLGEINNLLEQVARLQKSLKKSGTKKRHYLEELSKLQLALREDRLKIEAARESRHELHAKMNASTKATRDHQITINKLAKSLSKITKDFQSLAMDDLTHRLIRTLFEVSTKQNNKFLVNLTHNQLATRTSSSRESVSRVISKLKKNGFIHIHDYEIELDNTLIELHSQL